MNAIICAGSGWHLLSVLTEDIFIVASDSLSWVVFMGSIHIWFYFALGSVTWAGPDV